MNLNKSRSSMLQKTPVSRLQQSSRRARQGFKSPVRKPAAESKPVTESKESLLEEIKRLEQREEEMTGQIKTLHDEGLREEELTVHIEKLHEYNEIKDIGQALLGKIAMQQGVTTRQLYERFSLNLDD